MPLQDGLVASKSMEYVVASVRRRCRTDGQVVVPQGYAREAAETPVAMGGLDIRFSRPFGLILAVSPAESFPQVNHTNPLHNRPIDTLHIPILLPSDARSRLGPHILHIPLHPYRMAPVHLRRRPSYSRDRPIRRQHIRHPNEVYLFRSGHCGVDPVRRRSLLPSLRRRRVLVAV